MQRHYKVKEGERGKVHNRGAARSLIQSALHFPANIPYNTKLDKKNRKRKEQSRKSGWTKGNHEPEATRSSAVMICHDGCFQDFPELLEILKKLL